MDDEDGPAGGRGARPYSPLGRGFLTGRLDLSTRASDLRRNRRIVDAITTIADAAGDRYSPGNMSLLTQ
jgi:hypothetical protein